MSKKVIEPEGWRPSPHLSAGFRVGNFIFTSGQVGRNQKTGKMRETIGEQTEQALMNVKRILGEAGATVKDIAKITIFLPNLEDYDEMNNVYINFFDEPDQ